jgi:hypothetical protein
MSMCPSCRDVRHQEPFGRKTLLRLLDRKQPIEAWYVVCDESWEIGEKERTELTKRFVG